jgi:hypothetical protein
MLVRGVYFSFHMANGPGFAAALASALAMTTVPPAAELELPALPPFLLADGRIQRLPPTEEYALPTPDARSTAR